MDLQDVIDRIDAILAFEDFSRDLAAGLDLIRPGGADEELDALIHRVEGRFESSSYYPVVLQFLQDHSRLTDAQIIRFFEFVYSKLVNKFKGEIGEVLAARSIFEFRKSLGDSVEVLHGSWLSQRQLGRRGGWYDGADALYVVRDGDVLEVVAIAEVKSKATKMPDLREQVTKNILRLRRGLRLRGEEIPPERIRIRTSSGVIAARDIEREQASDVTSLMILPLTTTSGAPAKDPEQANVWLAELPASQDEITEAAYRFMSWYFSRIGPKVFYFKRDGAPPDGDRRVPAPHQDLSLEENGSHAFMEAIYHSAFRTQFDPNEVLPPGHRTAWQTLLWLYNSLGFGYDKATTDELMYPDFTPNPDHEAWLARHNAMLAAYRSGDIARALELFPDPALSNYADWAPPEWMFLARLRARNGDADGAREALRQLKGDASQSESLSTRMEYAAVLALIAFAENAPDANDALQHAAAVIEEMRELVRTHEANQWAMPANLTWRKAREAAIDLAVAYVLAGRLDVARETLLRLRDLEDEALELIANDRVLARVVNEGDTLQRLRETTKRRTGLQIF